MPVSRKRREAVKAGYRSGFEHRIAQQLEEEGVDFGYEEESFEVLIPASRSYRCSCGEQPYRVAWYTPDFFLPSGIIIECKGRFDPADRKKILSFKECHPDVDLRMVFEFDNKLTRRSKTRYSEWCRKNGIEYAIKEVPKEWL